jgi:hypothetical protein
MAGIARGVASGISYHIPQRRNWRREALFCAEDRAKELRRYEAGGRLLGREPFVVAVEGQRGRTFRRAKPGPKRGRAA